MISIIYFEAVAFSPNFYVEPFGLIVALLLLIPSVIISPLFFGVACILNDNREMKTLLKQQSMPAMGDSNQNEMSAPAEQTNEREG